MNPNQPAPDVSAPTAQIPPTPRSQVRRVPRRASYDRAFIHQILDEGLIAHVGFAVPAEGGDHQPYVIPMVYARQGDDLLLHGAAASRLLKAGAAGVPLCATVTLIDGLVLARSAFHHSMNYRSVVVLGQARAIVETAAKQIALAAFVDHVAPGRSQRARPPNPKVVAAPTVLALAIDEVSAKSRSGGPLDDEEDLAWPIWAGHLPLQLRPGVPMPDQSHPPQAEFHDLPFEQRSTARG
jgi:nitroimidazol reductase NimA-like FMN-containing flavoprotein (pyridoxamine 5'-phosphate oxidase superfamily)